MQNKTGMKRHNPIHGFVPPKSQVLNLDIYTGALPSYLQLYFVIHI
jgi:hypothetical protein